MTNSQLFKLAHAMTKQVIKTGDNLQADLRRAQYNSKGANNKGAKLSTLVNNEFAKMILKRNEVKTVVVEISFFSKVKSFFKAA